MSQSKAIIDKGGSVLVVGLGYRTGLHSANFLARNNCRVAVSDLKTQDQLAELAAQLAPGIELFAGRQDAALLDRGYELVVLSPGVPAKSELIQEALRRRIPVIAEVELAWWYMQGSWLAITGTDGKSTTTALTAFLLRGLGLDARKGGNIGIPLISMVESSHAQSVTVAELSSFQLETVDTFRPCVAAMLNLTPDHLDRYDGLDDYFKAKMNITARQTADDFFVYNADDARVSAAAQTVAARAVSFSLQDRAADMFYADGCIFENRAGNSVKVLEISALKILGLHNVANVMTALLMARSLYQALGLTFDIRKAAKICCDFAGLPHRMAPVGEHKGRRFINDSKATTVGAVEMALRSIDAPCVLILGGRGKGDDYSRLAASMKDRVRGLVLIGETTPEFAPLFAAFNPRAAAGLDDALRISLELSNEGDIVLLSPACASFDMFRSFEHRGDEFRAAFARLGD
jgi:UDP-N-acetylmuramoylalanine--D-glutamate ligase